MIFFRCNCWRVIHSDVCYQSAKSEGRRAVSSTGSRGGGPRKQYIYIYICICMYVYIYYIYIYIDIYVSISLSHSIYVCMCVYIYIYIYNTHFSSVLPSADAGTKGRRGLTEPAHRRFSRPRENMVGKNTVLAESPRKLNELC